MKNVMGVLALLMLSACSPETYDERAEHFAVSLCNFQVKCFTAGYDSCHQDVIKDMAKARVKMDQVEEQNCMKCMQVKIEAFDKYASSCNPPKEDALVTAACGAHGDEACRGYP